MRVSIHQPNYIPWIGYFHKIFQSDVHVFLDDVEYSKNGFINRNKILMNGSDVFLTIPISKKFHRSPLNEIIIQDKRWASKHLKTISQSYSKSPYYDMYYNEFSALLLDNQDQTLSKLNSSIIKWVVNKLGCTTSFVFSSQLSIDKNLKKTDLLLNILESLGATSYISGVGAYDYLDESRFKEIELIWQNFNHPFYNQNSSKFVKNLSIFDVLFNEGPATAGMLYE